jgi:hypothetical protein
VPRQVRLILDHRSLSILRVRSPLRSATSQIWEIPFSISRKRKMRLSQPAMGACRNIAKRLEAQPAFASTSADAGGTQPRGCVPMALLIRIALQGLFDYEAYHLSLARINHLLGRHLAQLRVRTMKPFLQRLFVSGKQE